MHQSGTKPNLVAKILATKFGFVLDCVLANNWTCYMVAITKVTVLVPSHSYLITTTHTIIGNQYISSTGTQSINELQWLNWMITYQVSNACNGHQGNIPH